MQVTTINKTIEQGGAQGNVWMETKEGVNDANTISKKFLKAILKISQSFAALHGPPSSIPVFLKGGLRFVLFL